MESGSCPKALQRILGNEMIRMHTHPTPGITLSERQGDEITEWLVDILGAAGTLYEGEKFRLHFKFPDDYPFKPPKVQFVEPYIPLNPHVFSNGHICLSILTKEWAPVLNVQGICLSILSMLSSCKEKKLPADNDYYLRMLKTNPEQYVWHYYNLRFYLPDDKA